MAESYLDWQKRRQRPGGGAVEGGPDPAPTPPVQPPQREQPAWTGGPPPGGPTRPPDAAPAAQPPAPAGATAASGANRPAGYQQPLAAASAPPANNGAAPANNGASTAKPAPAPAGGTPAPIPPVQPAASPQPQLNEFNSWATTTFGRAPTAQEGQQIMAAAGAPQGPNGTYTPQQIEQAKAQATTMARAQGWNGQGGVGTPAPPGPAVPPVGPNAVVGAFPGTNPGDPGHTGRVSVDPGQGYQAKQLGGFQAPNTGTVGGQNTALMQSILQNPESLPPHIVAAMKAAGKTSAANQAEQLRQQASTTLAGRGFSGAGGMQAAANAAVDQGFLGQLLDSNRDVDINAAQTNFANRLQASQAGTDFQNAATNRATAESAAEVQRFGANEGARQAQSADSLGRDEFRAGQMQNDRNSNLQEWMSRNSVNLDTNRLNETVRQFNQTFGFDVTRFLDDIRRDNRNYGENVRQADNNLGLNYNQLNQQAQSKMLDWLNQSTGTGR